jgi:flagellar protein FliO/FliZ
LQQFSQTIGLIVVLVVIIFASYFVTKYVAARAGGRSGKTRYFKVIDRFSLSKDKMFVMVAVGQTVYLVGVTNQGMTLLDQKDLSELPANEELTRKSAFPTFLSALKNARTSGFKPDGDGRSFSDVIKQARQKDDDHEN